MSRKVRRVFSNVKENEPLLKMNEKPAYFVKSSIQKKNRNTYWIHVKPFFIFFPWSHIPMEANKFPLVFTSFFLNFIYHFL